MMKFGSELLHFELFLNQSDTLKMHCSKSRKFTPHFRLPLAYFRRSLNFNAWKMTCNYSGLYFILFYDEDFGFLFEFEFLKSLNGYLGLLRNVPLIPQTMIGVD